MSRSARSSTLGITSSTDSPVRAGSTSTEAHDQIVAIGCSSELHARSDHHQRGRGIVIDATGIAVVIEVCSISRSGLSDEPLNCRKSRRGCSSVSNMTTLPSF